MLKSIQKCMDFPLLGFNLIKEIIRVNCGLSNITHLIKLPYGAKKVHKDTAKNLNHEAFVWSLKLFPAIVDVPPRAS